MYETRKKTGSHALMHALLEEGVETIFGYPGGAIIPVSMPLRLSR
jgi:acetolactate synthase-1/2/3 large subunit